MNASDTEHSYFYTTRTAAIPLTDNISVSMTITDKVKNFSAGSCESGASLECDPGSPNLGVLRVLPESMLPGSKSASMFQCLPCYEASAEAYVRKLHNYSE